MKRLSLALEQTPRLVTVKQRLALILLCVVGGALLLASAAFFIVEYVSFHRALVETTFPLAETIGINSRPALGLRNNHQANQILATLKGNSTIRGAYLFDANDQPFASFQPFRSFSESQEDLLPETLLTEQEIRSILIDSGRQYQFKGRYLALFTPVFDDGNKLGTVYLVATLDNLYQRLRWWGGIALIILLMAMTFGFILAQRLQQSISHPVAQLVETMRQVSLSNDFSLRTEKLAHDELGLLADGFNTMLEQVQLRDRYLEEANRFLEQRVKQRTQELEQSNHELIASRERFLQMVDLLPQPVFETDHNEKMIFTNRAGRQTFACDADDLREGIPLAPLFDGPLPSTETPNERLLRTHNGQQFPALIYTAPLIRNGRTEGQRGLIIDITDRKRIEEQVRASLREKEVLLREIHHRVKNNLQIITSLINLQLRKTPGALRGEIEILRQRIRTIGQIHEKLYRSDDLSLIDFDIYLKELAPQLLHLDPGKTDITIHHDLEPLQLDVGIATPCGMIVTELLTNTIKYAFAERTRGEVFLFAATRDGEVTLRLGDNGIGLPKDFETNRRKSLGTQLIQSFTSQIGGVIHYTQRAGGGTEVEIRFPQTLSDLRQQRQA
ncbi:MAG: hypothetical protein C0621_00695 [Desulfuromonas sp.]|nr:MAG: hypothetical protein C0621_00695 [Desulfuromonas sp.]